MRTWSERVSNSLRRALAAPSTPPRPASESGSAPAGSTPAGSAPARSTPARSASASGPAPLVLPLPRRRRTVVDPFSALEVQLALSRIEGEIAALQHDDGRFARGHHLIAARLAFDQLLDQACRLAGVHELPESGSLRRMMAEVELRARGWSW